MLKNNFSGFQLEAGTDEAGRGCLSGPVVAAAVILPANFKHELLNDSKQLSESKKKYTSSYYRKRSLIVWCFFLFITMK